MHDFCGWFTPAPKPEPVIGDTLGKLLAVRGDAPARASVRTHPHGTVAAVGVNTSVAEQDGLLAVIVGRPRLTADSGGQENPAHRLLQLWRTHGKDLPKHIQGAFALAIVDTREQATFLAIDRIGIQTLAFAVGQDGCVFSNRADVVAAHPDVTAALDPQGIFNYLYFTVVPAPGTVFQGIDKLLPGEYAYAKGGTLERGFYWHLRYRDEPHHDFKQQSARLQQLLRESMARTTGSDEVAAFLSGGIDSSTVAGVLTEVQGKPARTYSMGFAAEGFDEMEYARLAARHFGLDSREYYLTPDDVLTAIPLIAREYDEPFANESAVSAYFCAKLAKDDGYGVMLGGDGGDEIFGGNERYAKQTVFEHYQTIPAFLRHGLIEPAVGLPGLDRLLPTRKLQSYVRQARIPLPERMETYNYIYRQPLAEMFAPEFLARIDPGIPASLLKDPYDRADSQHFINRMLHLDIKFTLADNDLRKVTRMVEAAGVEARYPLLDDAMVEFSGEVPPDWKVKGHYLRWFFKTALKGYLPDAIINKEKHGFGLPFGLWLRDHAPLRERVGDRLSDFTRRGWLQPDYIARIQSQHRTEHASYFGKMLWVMFTLEEWLETHDIQQP
ncbi:asparagine synthetase B family protein [Thiocystis violascens]|uniref:asparagine synthase (glutamine-hydrolyzing) n=1 Tax=Thiocystis violascens (strain ATCC 17096 / DSM 198 / 6111) TaxID=765911 RepID=I3YEW2_THIV6|nr:asparagine synthase-related protein [Thiocystis violascens]AFL75530.1 asparagine synthase (glutamine-hydrolyzing) [Thiocystis violascens DSM 198]